MPNITGFFQQHFKQLFVFVKVEMYNLDFYF